MKIAECCFNSIAIAFGLWFLVIVVVWLVVK